MKNEISKSEPFETLDLSDLASLYGGKTQDDKPETGNCLGFGCKCTSGSKSE